MDVIFRAEQSGSFKGEVTAVLPSLPYDATGDMLTIYAHIGQHGAGSRAWYAGTRPATEAEYAPLLRELRGIYDDCDLVIRTRLPARGRK